jgi:hypothetical protein
MKMQEDKLSTTLTGISGEYFVAAELSRQGLIAAITLRNSRGADILASRPISKKAARVQVKMMQKGRTRWLLNKSDETQKGENHYYVFVALNGRKGHPEYHVVEGEYVAKWCRNNHQAWLKGKRQDGGKRKDSNIRNFCPGEEFRDRWDRIRLDFARRHENRRSRDHRAEWELSVNFPESTYFAK